MRHLRTVLIGVSLLPWAAALASAAVPKVVWSEEAEKFATPGGMRLGAAVADDPAASGGKAVRIPCQSGSNGWSMVFSAPRMEMRGQVLFTFWLRAENLPPLTPGFVLTLVAHDKQTGQWAFHRQTRVYGANLQPQGYTPVTLTLDVPWTAEIYGPEVILQWDSPPKGVAPVMYLDKAVISVPVLDAPRLLEVSPAKIRYQPQEKVTVLTSLVNPTAAAIEGTLVGEEIRAADTRREVFRENVSLAAGEQKQVTSSYRLGAEEYGREIRVRLLAGGREVSRGRDFFAVSKLPLWVAGGASGDRSCSADNSGAGSFYVGPASGQDSWRGVQYWKKMRRSYFEFFSWAPGDISDLAPSRDLFPGGEGRLTYRSRETIIQQNRMLRSVGIWPVSYVNGTCWAESGYKLFQQHPEWFLYDANGEVGGYEMDGRELYRRKDDANFDPKTYDHIFFQACLNHSLPAVQEYVARQFIDCGKVMGFAGVRLDVRYLEVYPGERDFDGKEVAATYPRGRPHQCRFRQAHQGPRPQGSPRLHLRLQLRLARRSQGHDGDLQGALRGRGVDARRAPLHLPGEELALSRLEDLRAPHDVLGRPGQPASAASTTPTISTAGAWSTPSTWSTRPFSASSAAAGTTAAGTTTPVSRSATSAPLPLVSASTSTTRTATGSPS